VRGVAEATAVDEMSGVVENISSRGFPGLRFEVGMVG
jgi:hypothetical protein